jgi:hypothetical protein
MATLIAALVAVAQALLELMVTQVVAMVETV